jgi:hypothetical protein
MSSTEAGRITNLWRLTVAGHALRIFPRGNLISFNVSASFACCPSVWWQAGAELWTTLKR